MTSAIFNFLPTQASFRALRRLLALGCLAAAFSLVSLAQTAPPSTTGGASSIAAHVVRARIAGIDVIAYPTGVKDVVTFRGSLPAGDVLAPASNLAIPTLVGAMLDKGTQRHDKFAIANQLESVGARLGFEVDETMLHFSGKCLRKDLPMVVSLLAEQLRMPAFSEEEFAKLKKHLAGVFQRMLERTDHRANEAFVRSIYPPGHPNHTPATKEFIDAVGTATLQEARAFHAAYYGPARLTLVVVGDIDVPALQAEVEKGFAGWTGGRPLPAFAKAASADAPREQTVFMPDKTNVSVILGQATGLRYHDVDTLALRIAGAVLGRGFTGRLMSTVRDTEGLTYSISAGVGRDTFADGDFRINAEFNPTMLHQGIASTRRELRKWHDYGVTAAELERVKKGLIGSYKVGMTTTDGLAESILTTVNRGYGVEWLDSYPARVNALTLPQVNAVIRKYLDPEKMTLVMAGTTVASPKPRD